MTPTVVILLVAFVVFDLLVVFGVLFVVIRNTWAPWTAAYPRREPAPDAVRRNFQSFRLGMINAGYSIHVAVDETHLHLLPARFLRWFGAKAVSVPWSDIVVEKRSRSGTWVHASIGRRKVYGPAWCLELAGPEAGTGAG